MNLLELAGMNQTPKMLNKSYGTCDEGSQEARMSDPRKKMQR